MNLRVVKQKEKNSFILSINDIPVNQISKLYDIIAGVIKEEFDGVLDETGGYLK